MYCKSCGAALPSHGCVCKSCGAMMDEEQIRIQKEFFKERDKTRKGVNLLSDKYSSEPIKRDYNKRVENKYLGALLIVVIMIILIVLAILKLI